MSAKYIMTSIYNVGKRDYKKELCGVSASVPVDFRDDNAWSLQVGKWKPRADTENFYTNSTRMQQMNGTGEESQQAVGIAKAKTTPENNDLIG